MTLPRLYAVLDTAVAEQHGWAPLDLGRAFLDGGARLIQLRAKTGHARWFLSLADALVAAGATVGASIIINDRADIALLAGAAGVHVGQDDLAPADARRVLGERPVVGWSTHTPAQVRASVALPVSYVAVGPVFETRTKDTGYTPVGTAFVREAVRLAGGRPVVAIGGITLDAAPAVIDAGASAVAIVGDLLSDGDPAARVAAYVTRLGASEPPKTGRV